MLSFFYSEVCLSPALPSSVPFPSAGSSEKCCWVWSRTRGSNIAWKLLGKADSRAPLQTPASDLWGPGMCIFVSSPGILLRMAALKACGFCFPTHVRDLALQTCAAALGHWPKGTEANPSFSRGGGGERQQACQQDQAPVLGFSICTIFG